MTEMYYPIELSGKWEFFCSIFLGLFALGKCPLFGNEFLGEGDEKRGCGS